MKKIAVVSTILPATNYTSFLVKAMQNYRQKAEVLVYADKNRENLEVDLQNVSLVWHKNFLYPIEILLKSLRDRISLVNLQFEINMYGGAVSAFIFPVLLLLLKLFNIKTVVTVHAVVPLKKIDKQFLDTFGWNRFGKILYFVRFCFFLLYRGIGLFSSAIIVHSKYLEEIFKADYYNKKEIFVIPHGVPDIGIINDFPLPKNIAELIGGRKIILYFGYLAQRKGIECLIDAFEIVAKEFQNYVLVIAGGTLQGDYEIKLKNLVKEKKLEENIIFTSFLSLDVLGAIFKKAEFFTLPCVYSISASGPFALSIASHKAVVATDIGVFSQEIMNGVNGLLSKPNDKLSLYANIRELIVNKELLIKIEENLILMHQQRKWSKIALDHLELFASMYKKTLLLCGAYGYGNPGDDAMLFIMVQYLKNKYPQFEIWANSYNPEETRKKLNINAFHTDFNRDILKKIFLIFRFDIVIYNGGTQIVEIPFTLLRMMVVNALAKIRGKKVIYFGVGVGFIKSIFLARLALYNSDLIILRDQESEDLLCKITTFKSTNIHTLSDPVFAINDDNSQSMVQILKREGLVFDDRLKLGVSVRVQNEHEDKLSEIIKALDCIVEKYNVRVVLIPWQKARFCRKDLMEKCFLYDDDACLKVIKLMRNGKDAVFLKEDYTPFELFRIISEMDLILGVPFHFLCMAVMNSKPLIGIDYSSDSDMKIYSLFKDLDELEYLFFKFDDVKNERICNKFDSLVSSAAQIVHKLDEKKEIFRQKSLKSFEYLKPFLE